MIRSTYLPFFLSSISLTKVADVQDIISVIFTILETFMTITICSKILGRLRRACTIWMDPDNTASTFFSKTLRSHCLNLRVRQRSHSNNLAKWESLRGMIGENHFSLASFLEDIPEVPNWGGLLTFQVGVFVRVHHMIDHFQVSHCDRRLVFRVLTRPDRSPSILMLPSGKASDLTYVKILHRWDVKKRLQIHQLILNIHNLD